MRITVGNAVIIGAASLLASCNAGRETADLPYGTVQQFMADEVQPTAEIYWGAVGSVSELVDGEPVYREFEPETDDDWAAIRTSASRLGDFGEVLMSPAYAEGRGEDWIAFSQGLVEISQIAEQAAIDRDPEAVFELGGTIYNVCQACHQMYPPENIPVDIAPDFIEEAAQ